VHQLLENVTVSSLALPWHLHFDEFHFNDSFCPSVSGIYHLQMIALPFAELNFLNRSYFSSLHSPPQTIPETLYHFSCYPFSILYKTESSDIRCLELFPIQDCSPTVIRVMYTDETLFRGPLYIPSMLHIHF
jgi:hypothetical protein